MSRADYQDIRFALEEGVATIELHRPDQLNAFSGRMGEELGDAYHRCDQDDAVRAVVLTGAGRAFCAGADMSAGEQTFQLDSQRSFSANPVSPCAFEIRKPVIAAMNGHAIGLGLTLALHCDIRIAAVEAKYGVVQVRRGMMPDASSSWTLPRIVGMQRAALVLLTGRRFDGNEIAELGLALQALPAAEVLPAATAIAREFAENTAPVSVGIAKKLLWESPGLSERQVEHRETALHLHLMKMPDAIEGPMAWIQKRAPEWKGTVSKDWPDWPDDD